MLEAKLAEAVVLKRLLDAVKELVTDANFECSEEGLKLQAMDNSHVALVAVQVKPEGFEMYRCDRPMPLGVNLTSLSKVLKCAKDDDTCTLKANDDADVLSLTYEAKRSDRTAEYEMKLMDIDADTLGIPDTEYDARVTMMASEFARICRDLVSMSESVKIEVTKEGIRFASEGDAANGSVLLKQTEAARRKYKDYGKEDEEEDKGEEGSKNANGEEADGEGEKVKTEDGDVDAEMNDATQVADEENNDNEEFKAKSDDEGEEEKDAEDEEESSSKNKKKRKSAPSKVNGKTPKRAKKAAATEDGEPAFGVAIEMNQSVTQTFSLKYLVNFSKSSALSDTVQLLMSNDVPLLVSYTFGQGTIQYYLAPKIGDE